MSQQDVESRAEGTSAPSLFRALVCGLIRGLALRDELGEPPEGPTGFELADHIDEILVAIDAEEQTVVSKRESDCQPRASADRAGEEKTSSSDGKQSDPAFNPAVIDFEAASSKQRRKNSR